MLKTKTMKTELDKQFSKDLGSYVSFALRENLFLSLANPFGSLTNPIVGEDKRPGQFFDQEYASLQTAKLGEREMASIEKLMARYATLQQYLPARSDFSQLEIMAGEDAAEAPAQQPGKAYRKVAVDANQLAIARFVAGKVAEIFDSYTKGAHLAARASYNALQGFLAHKRAAMVGSFESVTEIEESLGMHAVGTNGNPQALANPVVFVLIEIWLS